MKRAVWSQDGLEVTDWPALSPPPTPGWVRLAVLACGICGSDLHAWTEPRQRHPGTVPGHELCGRVIDPTTDELGEELYAVSPNVACGRCSYCSTGRTNLCRRGGFGIGVGRDGGFSDIVEVPIANLVAVPPDTDPAIAAMTEPLAVALRAVGRARVEQDSVALVLGGGTIGLLCAMLLREHVATVAITARYEHQRQAAQRIGALALEPRDAVAWGKEQRPDAVFETVGGAAATLNDAIAAVARGGSVVVLGAFGDTQLDMGLVMFKEVDVLGSFAYGRGKRQPEFAAAAEMVPRYETQLRQLITHRFPLDDIGLAFACASAKSQGAIKVTVQPDHVLASAAARSCSPPD